MMLIYEDGQVPRSPAVSMGRCNTRAQPSLTESTRLIPSTSIDSNKTKPCLGIKEQAQEVVTLGKALPDQAIRWCCTDRLSWQGFSETGFGTGGIGAADSTSVNTSR